MSNSSIRLFEHAVIALGLIALALGLTVYVLMEIQYRLQIGRNARRLILSSKLFPPLSGEALHAFWSRSWWSDQELIEDILVDMCRSSSTQVREVVERSIVEAGLLDRWIKQSKKGGVSRRLLAAKRLGLVPHMRSVFELGRAASDRSPEVRLAVTLSLGRLKDSRGLPGLLRIAADPPPTIPDLALAAALAGCAKKCPSRLATLLQAKTVRSRIIGALALSETADASLIRYLQAGTRDAEAEVRAKVARALARIRAPEAVEALCALARDPVWFVRVRALDALGRLQATAAEETVNAALKDSVREVRSRAAFALRQIRGMKGEVIREVLAANSRDSFESLISEWDRAGYLWEAVAGLSTRDFPRFRESKAILKVLVAAGEVGALTHLVLVFPDIKVKLRLLRLFLIEPSAGTQSALKGLADRSGCDRRLAAAIRRAFPSDENRPVAEVTAPSA